MMDCVVRKRMGGALSYIWSNKRDIFLKLKLPSALPYFFSALKIAVPLSVMEQQLENGSVHKLGLDISVRE